MQCRWYPCYKSWLHVCTWKDQWILATQTNLGTKLRKVRLKNGVGLKPIQVRFASRCQLCQTPEQELWWKVYTPCKGRQSVSHYLWLVHRQIRPFRPWTGLILYASYGCMRLMIEIGRIDIATEVVIIDSFGITHVKATWKLPCTSWDTWNRNITPAWFWPDHTRH